MDNVRRFIMTDKHLTREGSEKLKEELKFLKETKRKEIAERLEKCLAFGDLSENAEYHETKEEQAFVEGRILELEQTVRDAVILSDEKQNHFAQIGSTVLVSVGSRKEKFKIVGAEGANLFEGKISVNSPVGKAVINRKAGEDILVQTPQGQIHYKILKIE